MPYLTMHFEAEPRTDLHEAAAALGAEAGALPNVAAADARPEQVQAIGVAEVLLAITVATTVIEDSSKAVDALTRLVASIKKLAAALGLSKGRVEVGLRQIPIEKLTPDDLRETTED